LKNKKIFSQLHQLWRHLNRLRQLQFFLVLALMIITAITEVISLGAVIPFLGVLTAPDKVFSQPIVFDIAQSFGILSAEQLLLPITVLFITAIFLANFTRVLLLWITTKLSFMTGADLSFEVYSRTLHQPYIVHLERNSSEVITGILNKVGGVVFNILLPALTFISALILLVMVITALMVIDPVITSMTVIGFGSTYVLTTILTRKKILNNGDRIAYETTMLHKALQEGLGGIREVLLDGTQQLYCDIYRKADLPLRKAQASNIFISSSPKFAMEAIGVSLIAIIAYTFSQQQGGITAVIPTLGAIALGAQRLLPALQNCYHSWSIIAGSRAFLFDALLLLEQPTSKNASNTITARMDFKKSIRLDSISFRYNKDTPWVLKNLNLEINKGERIGFVGKTGSGKSTSLDLIMGLLEPTTGKVIIDGKPLKGVEQHKWRKNIAHVPQSIFLIDSSMAENIAFGVPKELIDIKLVQDAAKQAQISEFIESQPNGYDLQVGERGVRLSGGQRQRIGIARALYKKANVLMFDEATSALDDATEKAVLDAIEKLDRDITVLFIAHRLTTLRNCDRIIELKDGLVLNDERYEKMLELSPSFRSIRETPSKSAKILK
jgi:ABC-type multidrug transport system fused ATPase/permease subunit